MENLGVLQAKISLGTSDFNKGVRDVLNGFSSMGRAAITLNQSLALFDRFTSGVIGNLWDLAKSFVDTASEMDKLKLTLNTVTQGHGDEYFEKLNEWAIKMPLNTAEATKSFITFMAMGLKPTLGQMTAIMDAVSALGGGDEKLKSFTRALGEMNSMGVVHLRQLQMMAMQGVPVFDFLRKYTTLTEEQISHIGQLKVASDGVIKAIIYGMNQMYGGQSEAIMKRYWGLMETLMSQYKEFQRQTMDSGPMRFIEQTLTNITQKIESWRDDGTLQHFAQELGKDSEEAMKWVVEMAQKAWDNKGKVQEFFSGMKEKADEAWPVIKIVADTLWKLAEVLVKVVDMFPNGAATATVGIITARLFGTNVGALIAMMSLMTTLINAGLPTAMDNRGVINSPSELIDDLIDIGKSLKKAGSGIADGVWEGLKKTGVYLDEFAQKFNSATSIGPVSDARGGFYKALADSAATSAGSVEASSESIEKAMDRLKGTISDLEGFSNGLKSNDLALDTSKDSLLEYAKALTETGDKANIILSHDFEETFGIAPDVKEVSDTIQELNKQFLDGTISVKDYMDQLARFKLMKPGVFDYAYGSNDPQPGPNGRFDTPVGKADVGVENAQRLGNQLIEQVEKLNSEIDGLTNSSSDYDLRVREIAGDIEVLIAKHKKQIDLIPGLENAYRVLGDTQQRVFLAQQMRTYNTKASDWFNELNMQEEIIGLQGLDQQLAQTAQKTQQFWHEFSKMFSAEDIEKNPQLKEFTESLNERVDQISSYEQELVKLKALSDMERTIWSANFEQRSAVPYEMGGWSDYERIVNQVNEQYARLLPNNETAKAQLEAIANIEWNKFQVGYLATIQKAVSLKTAFENVLSSFKQNFTDFFMTLAETGKLSFGELGAALVKSLRMVAARMAAESLMNALFEGVKAIIALANHDTEGARVHGQAAALSAASAPMYMGFVMGSGLAAGMAHDGISNIPQDGTWLLKKGERVVNDRDNEALSKFLKDGGARTEINMPITIQGGDEQGVLKALPQLKSMIEDVVNNNISSNGSIRQTIASYT